MHCQYSKDVDHKQINGLMHEDMRKSSVLSELNFWIIQNN